MKILVCDDDLDILEMLGIYLKNDGYNVTLVSRPIEALNLIDDTYSLVILDITMPEIDGFELCKMIRKNYKMPILFLSARALDIDKFKAYGVGGDDYIDKPFNPTHLMLKIKSSIRRYLDYNNNNVKTEAKCLKIQDLSIMSEEKSVFKNDELIKLTKIEYQILLFLAINQGMVFSLEEIYQNVWKEETAYQCDNTVSVHVKRLREKLDEDNQKYIKTIWGFGYKIEKDL